MKAVFHTLSNIFKLLFTLEGWRVIIAIIVKTCTELWNLIKEKVFPIYLTKGILGVGIVAEIEDIKSTYRTIHNNITPMVHRLDHVARHYNGQWAPNMDNYTANRFTDCRTRIWTLEADVDKSRGELNSYFFITKGRYKTHRDYRVALIGLRNRVNEDLIFLEKEISRKKEPKGQKFCAVDPYGEENWEE